MDNGIWKVIDNIDFIDKKRYQLTDIFYNMRFSKEIWKGKYYVKDQKMFREIDKHNAVVRKLKGLIVFKAYHDSNKRNMPTVVLM